MPSPINEAEEPIGIVVSRYGAAAIIAGLECLIDMDVDSMTQAEIKMVEGLHRNLKEKLKNA